MRLRDLLDQSVVKVGLENRDKEPCFEEMINVLVRAGKVTIGGGIGAIRHERPRARRASASAWRFRTANIPRFRPDGGARDSSKGIEFESIDGERVAWSSCCWPGWTTRPHAALAEIARLVQMPDSTAS